MAALCTTCWSRIEGTPDNCPVCGATVLAPANVGLPPTPSAAGEPPPGAGGSGESPGYEPDGTGPIAVTGGPGSPPPSGPPPAGPPPGGPWFSGNRRWIAAGAAVVVVLVAVVIIRPWGSSTTPVAQTVSQTVDPASAAALTPPAFDTSAVGSSAVPEVPASASLDDSSDSVSSDETPPTDSDAADSASTPPGAAPGEPAWCDPNNAQTSAQAQYTGVFAQGAPVAPLVAALDDINSVPELSATATTFLADIAKEKPAPLTAPEALGRLSFVDGQDVSTNLRELDTASETACGIDVFSSDEVNSVLQSGPTRTGNMVTNPNGSYSSCGDNQPNSAGFISEARAVTFCGNQVVLTSMLTGATSTTATGDDEVKAWATGLHVVAWMTSVITPAVGLKPPVWTIRATLLNADSGKTVSVVIPTPSVKSAPAQSGTVNIEAAGAGDHFVVSTAGDASDSTTERILDPSGKITGTYQLQTSSTTPLRDAHVVVGPLDMITAFQGPSQSQIYNGLTGTLSAIPGLDASNGSSIVGDGGCGVRSLLLLNGSVDNTFSPNTLYSSTKGVYAASGYRDLPAQGSLLGVTRSGVIQTQTDANGDPVLALVSAATGKNVWTLTSKEIKVDSSAFILGLLLLTNNSDNKVLVDPATGKEATGVSAAARDLLIGNDAQSNWLAIANGKTTSYLSIDSSSSTYVLSPADGVCR